MSWDVVGLEELSNNALRLAIGVHVSCIEGRDAAIPGSFEEGQSLVLVEDPW